MLPGSCPFNQQPVTLRGELRHPHAGLQLTTEDGSLLLAGKQFEFTLRAEGGKNTAMRFSHYQRLPLRTGEVADKAQPWFCGAGRIEPLSNAAMVRYQQ